MRDRNLVLERAHAPHILLAAHGVNHRAGAEEEQGLEEGVREQVEDRDPVRADAQRQEHVAKLADGGVGEHALDIVLHQPDGGGEDRGERAHRGDDGQHLRRELEQRGRARHHVDAGRDHGGGVDQGGDRRGAFHGVGQPDVERKLRGFAGGADEQAERDPAQRSPDRDFRLETAAAQGGVDVGEAHGADARSAS